MNPCVSSGTSFDDFFWVDNYSVFVDYFKVNRGCACWRIHASALEIVSVMNTKSAATRFSLTISDSIGAKCANESMSHMWKQFRWLFWVGSDSVFLDNFWANKGCVRWRIHVSALEAISVMIFKSATTQFFSTISDSTGAVCADKSMHHLWM